MHGGVTATCKQAAHSARQGGYGVACRRGIGAPPQPMRLLGTRRRSRALLALHLPHPVAYRRRLPRRRAAGRPAGWAERIARQG